MRKIAYLLGLGLVVGLVQLAYDFVFDRAPPHRFVVSADKDIASAWLKLNGSDTAMQVSGKIARGSRHEADASGTIEVTFKDGTRSSCIIGYITNGEREPHRISIRNGTCNVPVSEI